jgi:hypothetical protein
MKNLLILIVAIAVFLHFYPQPEVTKFYEEQKAALLAQFNDATDTSVRLKTERIWQDLEPELKNFTKKEGELAQEITSTRENVKAFYQDYCKKEVRLYTFQAANQASLCKAITKYSKFIK